MAIGNTCSQYKCLSGNNLIRMSGKLLSDRYLHPTSISSVLVVLSCVSCFGISGVGTIHVLKIFNINAF